MHIAVPDDATVDEDWFDVLPSQKVVVTVLSKRPLKSEEIKITDYVEYIRKR